MTAHERMKHEVESLLPEGMRLVAASNRGQVWAVACPRKYIGPYPDYAKHRYTLEDGTHCWGYWRTLKDAKRALLQRAATWRITPTPERS
jgi:hypothetical protein